MTFSLGAPVTEAVALAGRHRQLATIASRLCSGRVSTSIVGERKTGKTSVLNALRSQRVRIEYGLEQYGLVLAYIDSQMYGSSISQKQFWRLAAQKIAASSNPGNGPPQSADMPRNAHSMYDFLEPLTQKNQTAVLLIDEFDYLADSAELGPDFFAGLRSVISTGRLLVVTASVTALPDLLQDSEGLSSPLWDLILPVYLPLLEVDDCRDCLVTCTDRMEYQFTPNEILELATISGGHPFLLQLAGEGLYQAYSYGLSDHERLNYAEEHSKAMMEQIFQLYWRKSPDEQKIVLASFALLEAAHDRGRSFSQAEISHFYNASPAVFGDLQRRSLLRRLSDKGYQLLCPGLASWITAELTASKSDPIDYESWLTADHGATAKLSSTAKKELRYILPRIASNYRELVIAWASNPESLMHVVTLLRSALGPS